MRTWEELAGLDAWEMTDEEIAGCLNNRYEWIVQEKDKIDAHALAFDYFRQMGDFEKAERHALRHGIAQGWLRCWERDAAEMEAEQRRREEAGSLGTKFALETAPDIPDDPNTYADDEAEHNIYTDDFDPESDLRG